MKGSRNLRGKLYPLTAHLEKKPSVFRAVLGKVLGRSGRNDGRTLQPIDVDTDWVKGNQDPPVCPRSLASLYPTYCLK